MYKHARLLLVDDDEMFRLSTTTLLHSHGYACDSSSNVTQATTLLHTGLYALLISDINMPGNRQFEFITDVIQRYPQLPIILVTGTPTLLTLSSAVGPPIASFLIKPFPIDALLACIRTALNSRPQEHARVSVHAGTG